MTKKYDKRPRQNEKGQEGCMWSWMNIFGFRHGQKSLKRSSDKRHVNNHTAIGYTRNETKSLNKHNDSHQRTTNGEETTTASGDTKPMERILTEEDITSMRNQEKQNVEILMEEEMTSVQDKEEPTPKVLMREEISDGPGKEECVKVFGKEELTGGQDKEKEHSICEQGEKMTGSLGKEKDPSVQVLMEEDKNGGNDREKELNALIFMKEEMVDWQDNEKEPSVKILGEEDVTCQQDKEKVTNLTQSQAKEPRSVREGRKKKNMGNRKKSRRKTGSTEVHDVSAYEDLKYQSAQSSDKQSLKDHKIDNIMEEFCLQIHQRSMSCKKHDQTGGIRLGESIKEFIHQKLKDIDQCFEEKIMDAFDVLSLEEELFLKLIQDPDSPLKKSLRYWKGTLADRDRKLDFFSGSRWSEQKSSYSRKPEDIANHRHRNFFRIMAKSEDRSQVKEGRNSPASNKMVTSKSRFASSPMSDTKSSLGPSLKSHCDVRKKVINERLSFYFFFTKLGRNIRSAIRRERPQRTSGSTRNRFPVEHHNSGDGNKTTQDDNAQKSSPGKDQSFFRKYSKSSTQLKRGDSHCKEKDCDSIKEQESASNPRKKESRFNTRAKIHLSKKMSRVHLHEESSTQRVSATLGTILSLSENKRRESEYSVDMTLENSDHDNFQTGTENTQLFNEERVGRPTKQLKVVAEEYPDTRIQSIYITPNITEEITFDDTVVTRRPMKKESKLDMKAKKHLSRMLKKRQGNQDSQTQSAPDILGRIISHSEYNLSPIKSPGRDSKHSFDMPLKNFDHDKVQTRKENTQWLEEEKGSHPVQCDKVKTDSCAIMENPGCNLSLNTTNEITCDNTMESTCPNTKKESKINIRAKKHLSKRLSKSIGHEEFSIQSGPETLGRILSLFEYNLSSINSPNYALTCDDIVSENDSCSINSPSYELTCDNIVETASPAAGDVDISNARKYVCQVGSHQLDASDKPTSYSSSGDYQSDDLSKVRDSCNSGEVQSLQSPSPHSSSYNKKDDEPRPITFLEHSFPENDSGQATTISLPDEDNHPRFSIEVKESVFECVSAILQASSLKLDELYMKSLSPEHLLDPSLLDEIECCKQLHHDKKLLFDITNNVLMEVHACYFRTSPWVSFIKPGFKPIFNTENAFTEVLKGVCWYLFELQLPCSPDKIIKDDMERNGSWLDLRYDAENIGFRMGDAILEELVEDTIISCLREF